MIRIFFQASQEDRDCIFVSGGHPHPPPLPLSLADIALDLTSEIRSVWPRRNE